LSKAKLQASTNDSTQVLPKHPQSTHLYSSPQSPATGGAVPHALADKPTTLEASVEPTVKEFTARGRTLEFGRAAWAISADIVVIKADVI
jgi:hypothetical protein